VFWSDNAKTLNRKTILTNNTNLTRVDLERTSKTSNNKTDKKLNKR